MKKSLICILLAALMLPVSSASALPASTSLVPVMTSNTSPSGTVFSSSHYSDRDAYRAFDGKNTDYFVDAWEANYGKPQWIGYDFGAGNEKVVKEYILTSSDYGSSNPTNWQFQASNDGSTWTTLQTVSTGAWSNTLNSRDYTVSNSTAYRYYRLYITADMGDGYTIIGELKFLGYGTAPTPPTNSLQLVRGENVIGSKLLLINYTGATNIDISSILPLGYGKGI